MSVIANAAVRARRVLVRRPWIYWVLVLLATLGVAANMLDRTGRVDAARRSWGGTEIVLVATEAHAPGDALAFEQQEFPAAMVGDAVVADRAELAGMTARQDISAGEIIHDVDVVVDDGPLALTPAGSLVVPIVESPTSGASIGERVQVVSDGVVVSAEAVVVGRHDDVTLTAVPAAEAPAVAAAARAGGGTLLRAP